MMWERIQCWFALLQSSAFLPQQDTAVWNVPSFAWHFPWVWEIDSLQLSPYHWQIDLTPVADSALSHFTSFTAHSPQPAFVRNCAPPQFPFFDVSDRECNFLSYTIPIPKFAITKLFCPYCANDLIVSVSYLGRECERPGDTESPLYIC